MEHFRKSYNKSNYGFTIIELLVALAISGLFLTAIYNIFISNNIMYLKQNQLTKMEQGLRSAISLIAQEVRMAGYAPNSTYDVGLNSTSFNKLLFSYYDSSQNSTKIIGYELYDSEAYGDNTLGRIVNGYKQPMLQNVSEMSLSYGNCSVEIYLEVYAENNNLGISNLDMNKTVYVRNACIGNL
jgi:prepilin-type N-terminal cleavage/methylation domain-containing protein